MKLIDYKKLKLLVFRTGNHVYIPAPLYNIIDIFEKIMYRDTVFRKISTNHSRTFVVEICAAVIIFHIEENIL